MARGFPRAETQGRAGPAVSPEPRLGFQAHSGVCRIPLPPLWDGVPTFLLVLAGSLSAPRGAHSLPVAPSSSRPVAGVSVTSRARTWNPSSRRSLVSLRAQLIRSGPPRTILLPADLGPSFCLQIPFLSPWTASEHHRGGVSGWGATWGSAKEVTNYTSLRGSGSAARRTVEVLSLGQQCTAGSQLVS